MMFSKIAITCALLLIASFVINDVSAGGLRHASMDSSPSNSKSSWGKGKGGMSSWGGKKSWGKGKSWGGGMSWKSALPRRSWRTKNVDLTGNITDPHRNIRNGAFIFNPSTDEYIFNVPETCRASLEPPMFVRLMYGFPGLQYWYDIARRSAPRCCSTENYQQCKCPVKNKPWVQRKMKNWCGKIIENCFIEDPNKLPNGGGDVHIDTDTTNIIM